MSDLLVQEPAPFRVGLAVTTRGERLSDLERLIRGLPPGVRMSIAWQSMGAVPAAWSSLGVRVVRSSGGASKGRNDAAGAMPGDVDWLVFPNDDGHMPWSGLRYISEFDPSTADVLLWELKHPVDGELVPRSGLRPWRAPGSQARRVLTASIESGMAVSAKTFADVGGFESSIGVGSSGLVQSGEGADLLARVLSWGTVVDVSDHVVTIEPGTRERDTVKKVKQVKYAMGPIFVLARNRNLVGRRRALVRHICWCGKRFKANLPVFDMVRVFRQGARLGKRSVGPSGRVVGPKGGDLRADY